MTRNLPEPKPEVHADVDGKKKVHGLVDATLVPLICRRFTGRVIFEANVIEGNVRSVKVNTEEMFKNH